MEPADRPAYLSLLFDIMFNNYHAFAGITIRVRAAPRAPFPSRARVHPPPTFCVHSSCP